MLTYRSVNLTEDGIEKGAILLLHAFPLSAAMWKPQLEALGNTGYAVIAPNAYGIEGSEERKAWTFTDYAHELAALLESLKIERVTIVGLSMGGYQAFEFFRLYPGKTASLVLCDTRAEADAPAASTAREEFIRAIEAGGAEEAARRMIPNYFTPETCTMRPELLTEAAAMIRKQSATVINSAMRAIMMRSDATPLLATIHCPVLVLNGKEDKLTTSETAESIHTLIPHSELHLLAGAAHISNMEQAEAYNCALLAHIEEVRRS
jgi:3-oxoadipate enol-lactonase